MNTLDSVRLTDNLWNWVARHIYIVKYEEVTDMFITSRFESLDKDDLNKLENITPIPRVPKLLPVGTKVRVFEEYNRYMWQEIFTVKSEKLSIYTIIWDGSKYQVPARAVYPIWDREE